MPVRYGIFTYQSADIERIQKRALRIILPSLSYREALCFTGITTLKDRRESLCSTFFNKNRQNDKLVELFPEFSSVGYDLRSRLHETGTKSNRHQFVSVIVLFIYNRCSHETGTKITQTGLKSFRLLNRTD